ncbi:hypothetical protein [Thermoactinospora rubra]|uniref:hypothetical protein n=1 Tax=Thermoactinospora rubra TaxID=1088767 RepID=UPI00117F3455|nr:hypothetical protein [Thermoactinospora rubra]
MSLRDHMQAIYDQYGKLTPELVVEVAKEPDHPLHDRFEWDDSVAAEAWRREQAHRLIQKCKVVYREADDKNPEQSVRAFHAVRSEKGHVYEPVERVTADPFMAQLVLQDMEREWKALKRRYEHFSEFYAMVRRDLDKDAA